MSVSDSKEHKIDASTSPSHRRSASDDTASRVFTPVSSISTRDDLHLGTRLGSIGERDEPKEPKEPKEFVLPREVKAGSDESSQVQTHLFMDWVTGTVRQVVLDSNGLSYLKTLELSGIVRFVVNGSWLFTDIGNAYFDKWTNWLDYMDTVEMTTAWCRELLQEPDKLSAFLTTFAKNREYSSTIVKTSHIRNILHNISIKNAQVLRFGASYEMPHLVKFVIAQKVKDTDTTVSTETCASPLIITNETPSACIDDDKNQENKAKEKKSTMDSGSESDKEDDVFDNWDDMYSAVSCYKQAGKHSVMKTIAISSTRAKAVKVSIVVLMKMCQDAGLDSQATFIYNDNYIDDEAKFDRLNTLGRFRRSRTGLNKGPRFWVHIGSCILNKENR